MYLNCDFSSSSKVHDGIIVLIYNLLASLKSCLFVSAESISRTKNLSTCFGGLETCFKCLA